MRKYDIQLVRMSEWEFECQITIVGFSLNVKIGFKKSKYDIRLQFECQNKISNIKIRNLGSVE